MRREEADVAQARHPARAANPLPHERQPLADVERIQLTGGGQLVDDKTGIEPEGRWRLPTRPDEELLLPCLDDQDEGDGALAQPLRPGDDRLALRRQPLRPGEDDLKAGCERPVGGRLDARR